MKSFISASTISWFYFIENIITVLLSDTPWCFSPTMIIRYPCSIYCCNQYFKKKVKSYLYYIMCFVSFSRIDKISNISSDETHVFNDISIDIYHSHFALLSFVLCIKFEDDSRVINRSIVVFFATFWQNKNPHANTC